MANKTDPVVKAKVSIIIPTYNYGRFLDECLAAVHAQTYGDFDALIIDNASEDNTQEVVKPWLERDKRFRYVRNESNIGLRASLAKAYAMGGGEYVVILSSDDYWSPAFLEKTVSALEAHPECSFAYVVWRIFVDIPGHPAHGNEMPIFVPHDASGVYDDSAVLLAHNWITNSACLFRREVCDAIGGITPAYLYHVGDWYLWMCFLSQGQAYYIHEQLAHYRKHGRAETERLIADDLSAYDHLHFYDLIFQSDAWSMPIRWLAKAHQFRWLMGEPLITVARKLGGDSAMPLMRQAIAPHRENVLVGAAKAALEYVPEPNYLDHPGNAIALLYEVLAANPGNAEARDLLSKHRPELDGKPLKRRPRVVVYSGEESPWACAQIRLLRPFEYLAADFELVWATHPISGGHVSDLNMLKSADLVVLQRYYVNKTNKGAIETILNSGRPVVFELDELVYDLPLDNPHYDSIQPNQAYIRSVVDRVDAVIVSTPALGQELQQSCKPKQVAVLPNLVDAELFHAPVQTRAEPVRIALAGTPTHKGDYAMLDEVIERLLKKYPSRLLFVFIGVVPGRWQGHPAVAQIEFISDYLIYAKYLLKFELDIALVPLKDDSKFNRCKSNIKWLEYSAAGIAGVYSDKEPYACIRHGETGLKVDNSADAWFSAVCELVDNPEKRQAIALAAQHEVEEAYSLQKQGHRYAQCYEYLLSLSTAEVPVENQDRPAEASPARSEPVRLQPAQGQPIDLYQLWQSAHAYQDRDVLWIAERIAALASPPLFHLAVILPEENGEWLVNTIEAIANQFYKRWRLTVVANMPEPESFAGLEIIRWVQLADERPLQAVNKALQEVEADWVGMVEAGDRIAPHGLFALADKIDRHPEWSALYTDEDSLDDTGNRSTPFFKPDFDLDMLRSASFAMGGLFMLKRELHRQLGGFRPEMEGVEYYDLQLRVYESAGDAGIGHVADVLYHRFAGGGHCTRGLDELTTARQQAVEEHLARCGLKAELRPGRLPGTYQLRYLHERQPLVSIVIPTKNQLTMLRRCIDTVVQTTAYQRYEIIIVDNGSDEADVVALLDQFRQAKLDRLRVLDYPHPFNFSAMNNLAAREARGEYLLLLNNDTAVLQADWLDEMLSYAQRPDVGAVGAKLIFPNGRIQHAGVVLGMQDSPAEHQFIDSEEDAPGYFGRLHLPQNLSAVTAACMLVRKSLYDEVQGLDEIVFKVDYNDIDLCLKLRAKGYRVVWTPYAVLLHEGSVSQTANVDTTVNEAKQLRRLTEKGAMYDKWQREIAFDPAFNRNLSLSSREYQIELMPMLSLDPEWRPRPRVLVYPSARLEQREGRAVAPMRALNRAGNVMGWETQSHLSMPKLFRFDPGVIVFHRQIEPGQVQYLEYCARHAKAFRVFQFDELLADWQTGGPEKHAFLKAAGLCNRLVVPTEYLAETYAGCAQEVVVVPDYLERARWANLPAPMRRQSDKPRVGWVGTAADEDDLAEIAGVIEAMAQEVDWVFLGSCPESLRPYVKEHHQSVDTDDYPAKLASLNLDLAVAPLKDTPQNCAKGHTRLLEYGLMGYPVICSEVAAYGSILPIERVSSHTEDWVHAIRSHVDDMDALANKGDALKHHVDANWMLQDHLDVWLKAWLP